MFTNRAIELLLFVLQPYIYKEYYVSNLNDNSHKRNVYVYKNINFVFLRKYKIREFVLREFVF